MPGRETRIPGSRSSFLGAGRKRGARRRERSALALTTDGGADISVRKGGAPFRSERRRLICLVFTNCRVFRGDEFQVVKETRLHRLSHEKLRHAGPAGFACSPGFISVRLGGRNGSGGEDLGYFAPGKCGFDSRRLPLRAVEPALQGGRDAGCGLRKGTRAGVAVDRIDGSPLLHFFCRW